MEDFLATFNLICGAINGVLWHDFVLYAVLAAGAYFLVATKFSPLTAFTHGIQVLRGKYDHLNDPGAISHFQALSAALSATVGLGNIGGVAVAIAIGGPGAVFWMWVIGFIGMALKTVEVTLTMLYRNVEHNDDPHGGPMWVVDKGLAARGKSWAPVGKLIGKIFCITLLISAVTGGNMFQAWNVAEVTYDNFGLSKVACGVILAVISGLVIIGGIKRIGSVAGKLVPGMCAAYLLAGLAVIVVNYEQIPEIIALIFSSAFTGSEASGAFLGGSFGYAFLWGMKRALFSSEAGQGSAPIAHAAARTDEPVREGVVAGLEPFIDTLVVCTFTALIILSTGAWNRGPEGALLSPLTFQQTNSGTWTANPSTITDSNFQPWKDGQKVFVLAKGDYSQDTASDFIQVNGTIYLHDQETPMVKWDEFSSNKVPVLARSGIFAEYRGASLTAHAFDRTFYGLGGWIVTIASWLFAISTIISWSYYGEQGVVYLAGEKSVLPYKLLYCILIIVATMDIVRTTEELGNLTDLGTGVMLWANIPICLIFAKQGVSAYNEYVRKWRAGDFEP